MLIIDKTPLLQDLITYLGGVRKTALAFQVSSPAVSRWQRLPSSRAIQAELITKGQFKAIDFLKDDG
jgi:hypothetical protein